MTPMTLLLALSLSPAQQDTLVVRADNPPVWGTALHLVEEVRIGLLDGDENYMFGDVADVAVDADGTIWVADAQARTIKRYDSGGRYIDSIGRPGEGPGEFRSLTALELTADGRFAAWDAQLVRASLFNSAGGLDKTFSLRLPVTVFRRGVAEILRADDLGHLYVFGVRIGQASPTQFGWLKVDTSGAVLDTIPFPDARTEGPRGGVKQYPFGRMGAFSIVTRGALSPKGYLVVGRNNTYSLTLPRPDGVVLRIDRAWAPLPAGGQERAERQALVDYSHSRNPSAYPAATVPNRKPPYWAFWVDQEARIWVARHTAAIRIPEGTSDVGVARPPESPPSEWWEPLVLDVIGPEGSFLGTVAIGDHRTDLRVARGQLIWVIERGEFDEQYVVRYRIESD